MQAELTLDWKNPASIRKSLYAMQKMVDARAPYLDSFIFRMNTSLDLLRSEDTIRTLDTLNFIKWHRAFLQNLMWEKKQQPILDTLCSLLTFQQVTSDSSLRETNRQQFEQWFAELLSNDSSLNETHLVEAEYRKKIGKMQMPY